MILKGRPLRSLERPFACSARATLPIVVDANATIRTATSLSAQIKEHRDAMRALLHEHGAILFRGFDVQTDADFETIVLHHDARPMSTYFMSESGRDRVPGTRGVLNTSSLYKTGGGFYFGGFHSENFYTTDVPALQAFWCKEPPRFGGETALVQSADVYDALSGELKTKLAEERVLAASIPLERIADRYGIDDVTKVEALCRDVGLEIEAGEVRVFKPPVIKHPHTGRLALQVNLSGEVPGFDAALRRHAAASYRGWRWSLHRALWRTPTLASLLPILDSYPLLVETLKSVRPKKTKRAPAAAPTRGRIAERLTTADIEELAQAVWKHTSLFTWQRSDVLVCDQLQLLHAGMPGHGRDRELHVMMCDPIQIDLPLTSGLYAPIADPATESIGERLMRARARTAIQDPAVR